MRIILENTMKLTLLLFVIVLLVGGVWVISTETAKGTKTTQKSQAIVKIKNSTVNVELANTPQARELGLMFRKSLKPDAGMLFIFPTESTHSFWMKNTEIPLDILWINADKRIFYIQRNAPTCKSLDAAQKNCPMYIAEEPAKYVLEVNAGWVEKNNVSLGDEVQINLTNGE